MKRVLFLLLGLLLLVAMSSPALAENSLEAGSKALIFYPYALTTGVVKYFLTSDMAVLGSFGFDNSGTSGNKGTMFSLGAGVAKYLKTEDVARYVGAGVSFVSWSDKHSQNMTAIGATAAESATSFSVSGLLGLEAFLHKSVSVSGECQLSFGSNNNTPGKVSSSMIATSHTAVAVTVYF